MTRRRASPRCLEPDYREAVKAEASIPAQAETHYAIAKQLQDRSVLPDMPQQGAADCVRSWRGRPSHRRATVLHWGGTP